MSETIASIVRRMVESAPDTGRLHDDAIGAAEKPLIEAILAHAHGNQTIAAQVLGINRNTLRTLIAKHGIGSTRLGRRQFSFAGREARA